MTSVSPDSYSAIDAATGRTPPWNAEAEQAVLGAMMLDQDAALRAVELLTADMFYRESHRRLFRAMATLTEQRTVIDHVTLRDELARRGELDDAGGVEYLAELVNSVPTAANATWYAQIVRDKAVVRDLIHASTEILRDAYDSAIDPRELLAQAESKVFGILEQKGTGDVAGMAEILHEAMARIEESSSKISDIIGVIDEIARQTNLLALNAAVEAARAGEAGRGFAVVASEVRSLAQRSSQAAKDIKDLIVNSSSQVKDGVELVNRAGSALSEIVESIKKVTAIVSDIASASVEQSSGIDQINKALTQMDEVTQQNSALVEENAATAKTLERQAALMDERNAQRVKRAST